MSNFEKSSDLSFLIGKYFKISAHLVVLKKKIQKFLTPEFSQEISKLLRYGRHKFCPTTATATAPATARDRRKIFIAQIIYFIDKKS